MGSEPAIAGNAGNMVGPLIREVEERIIAQQGDTWDRELFEQYLMGYTMRTNLYRLVQWRVHRDPKAEPIFVELFDQENDPEETKNVAGEHPKLVEQLTDQMNTGWKAALAR